MARDNSSSSDSDHGGDGLRIAIILNSYHSRFLPSIRASYVRTIGAVAPTARLVFFEPANCPGDLPSDPTEFDLIVLGGGNVDPRKSWPWMLDVHAFVRRLVAEHPTQKLLGICWGHQTIHRVFGGKIVDSHMPEMGVAKVHLTEHGQSFFFPPGQEESSVSPPPSALQLQQHHRREVAVAAPGFVPLAKDNQCMLHERSNAILTFQGHPEKDAETARLRLHDAARWFGLDDSSPYWHRLREMMDMDHDGSLVWRQILAWVRQGKEEQQQCVTGVAQEENNSEAPTKATDEEKAAAAAREKHQKQPVEPIVKAVDALKSAAVEHGFTAVTNSRPLKI